MDNAAFNSAAEILSREDFYRDAHRRIFEAMGVLSERSQPIDLVTLKDELGRRSALEAVGGAAFLASLVDGVPRITSVEHWSRLIKEKAVLRNLIHAGNRIVQECYEGEDEPAELLDRAEKAIFDIAETRVRAGLRGHGGDRQGELPDDRPALPVQGRGHRAGHRLRRPRRDDERAAEGRAGASSPPAPPWGRPRSASTSPSTPPSGRGRPWASSPSRCPGPSSRCGCCCADARIDAHRLRTGKLTEKDWARLAKSYTDLSQARIFIDDSATITPLEMRAKCRRLKAEHGLGLIIVDYLQLVTGAGRIENRQQEISSISRSMKGLAKELDVPVIALSQLSRAPEARTDRRPQLSDLRESGAIEQDADIVMFIYREEEYKPTDENQGIAEIIIGKQRNGPTGSRRLAFIKEFTRFENLEWRPS